MPERISRHAALAGFVGSFEQLPPPFSAKKVKGQKYYELARRGEVSPPDDPIYLLMAASMPPAMGSSSGTSLSSLAIMSASSRAPSTAGPVPGGSASLNTTMPPGRGTQETRAP